MNKFFLFSNLLVILAAFPNSACAQNKIDSLKSFIKKSPEDTTKVKSYNALGKEFEFVNQDSALLYLAKGYSLAARLKYEKGRAISLVYIGYIAEDRTEYDSAKTAYDQAYAIFRKINDKRWQAEVLKMHGEVNKYKANLPQALSYYQQSLKLYESLKDEDGVANVHYSLGGLYMSMNLDSKALENYKSGYEINKKLGDRIGMANSLTAIGIIYDKQKNYKKAKENYFEAKKIYEEYDYNNGLSNLLTWIAITAYNEKDIATSLDYFQKSLKLYEKINNVGGLMYVYNNIGSIYMEQGDYDRAIEWQHKSLEMSLNYKVIDNIRYAYEMLSNTYERKGDFKNAFYSHRNFMRYKDSAMNETTSKQLAELDKKFESAKKDKELIQKDAALVKQAAETEKQTTQRNYFILGFTITLILVAFVFRGYRQKQKANVIIARQKHLVEEKQKEIVDSISYAKRLQQAILPPLSFVKQHFPESFILFQPKDIVAGDFYWMEIVSRETGNNSGEKKSADSLLLIAAADCTGHGVPGAMVSVVCSNALNRTLKEFNIHEPGKILDKVRDLVIETFEKSESEVKDGMDISLCSFDEAAKTLIWSGANNPLWIIRNKELIEVKANKQPIGKTESPRPFDSHRIKLEKGDAVYLFSDGYADQFGGDKGKKFKYKQLQNLLLECYHLPMNQQQETLEKTMEIWKGDLEQVDDILIIGIKV